MKDLLTRTCKHVTIGYCSSLLQKLCTVLTANSLSFRQGSTTEIRPELQGFSVHLAEGASKHLVQCHNGHLSQTQQCLNAQRLQSKSLPKTSAGPSVQITYELSTLSLTLRYAQHSQRSENATHHPAAKTRCKPNSQILKR